MTTILTRSLAATFARDVMHSPITSCDPSTPLAEVAAAMADQRIHCLLVDGIVHDASGDRLVWSVVSDLDLVRGAITGSGTTAGGIARSPVLCVDAEDDLLVIAVALAENGTSHAVVTDDERPVGIVSTLDVVAALRTAPVGD
ncbi:cyclic nucleotide-binding/CBS domain-containing protein [Patulibacter sp.]|uniref:CBS domain-containing protein n=1 Tax=Patulibacter sp. TaxID=1912859 RepID=UPI002717760B|nr:CBS domain-containing protein [Patulibacter sp.]MDO9410873.1 CBS domain-containing protein [Patulibacter sp.]